MREPSPQRAGAAVKLKLTDLRQRRHAHRRPALRQVDRVDDVEDFQLKSNLTRLR